MKPFKIPYGTFINIGVRIIGYLVGLLHKENFPNYIQSVIFQGNGSSILLIGLKMVFEIIVTYGYERYGTAQTT